MSASSKKKLRKEENAALLTEKQQAERKEAKKLKIMTVTFVAVIALVLAIGLVSMGLNLFNNSGIVERSTAALTVGEHKLNSNDLNYFFIDTINQVYSEWQQAYGDYTATYVQMFFGLDMSQPLDEQMYDEENGITFADYFTDLAVNEAVNTLTVYDKAVAENFQMTDAQKAAVDVIISNVENTAAQNGYASLNACLKAYYGAGANEKSYREYLEIVTMADAFTSDYNSNLTYNVADLDAYSQEHYLDYSSFSYATFTLSDDDFVVCTAKEDDKDHKHTDEELAAAIKAAEKAANDLVAAKPETAEELDEAIKGIEAYAESDVAVSIKYNDTLYSGISNTDIAQWLAEDGREAGDMKIITNASTTTNEDGTKTETPYGYTVVLYTGRNDNNMLLVNVRHILSTFQGGTTDENGQTVYSDAEKQTAKASAELVRDNWLAAGATEEAFSQLAAAHSFDAGSANNGGLYNNVYPGQTVTAFNDWCFDEDRKAGDYEIVETELGYHLIYFVGHSDVTFRNFMIENTLRNEDYTKWYNEIVEGAEYTVIDTSKLATDLAMLR